MRVARVLAALGLIAAGAVLALYGAFAVVYRGDAGGSGDTYVKLAGRELDADLAGAVALVAGALLVIAGVLLTRARTQ